MFEHSTKRLVGTPYGNIYVNMKHLCCGVSIDGYIKRVFSFRDPRYLLHFIYRERDIYGNVFYGCCIGDMVYTDLYILRIEIYISLEQICALRRRIIM